MTVSIDTPETLWAKLGSKIEPPEFVAWFERWYSDGSEFAADDPLRQGYYVERNFALNGWLAARNEDRMEDRGLRHLRDAGWYELLRREWL